MIARTDVGPQKVMTALRYSGLVGAVQKEAVQNEPRTPMWNDTPVPHAASSPKLPPIPRDGSSPAPRNSPELERMRFSPKSVASPPMRVAIDATDALADDMASHGQRLNPARLAEQRQQHVAIQQYQSAVGLTTDDELKKASAVSPRELARSDPKAAVGGTAKPSPYAMLHTLSSNLLPQTPHVTPAALRMMRLHDFESPGGGGGSGVGGEGGGGSGEAAQQWLRQVASEANLYRRPQRRRVQKEDLLKPVHEALERHASEEQQQQEGNGGSGGETTEAQRNHGKALIYIDGILTRTRKGSHTLPLLCTAITQCALLCTAMPRSLTAVVCVCCCDRYRPACWDSRRAARHGVAIDIRRVRPTSHPALSSSLSSSLLFSD